MCNAFCVVIFSLELARATQNRRAIGGGASRNALTRCHLRQLVQ